MRGALRIAWVRHPVLCEAEKLARSGQPFQFDPLLSRSFLSVSRDAEIENPSLRSLIQPARDRDRNHEQTPDLNPFRGAPFRFEHNLVHNSINPDISILRNRELDEQEDDC